MEQTAKTKKSVLRRQRKEERKEAKQNSMELTVHVRNVPTPVRKMRLVTDLVRNLPVYDALNTLKFTPKSGAPYIEKLILSAIAGWSERHEDLDPEDADLYVKEIFANEGRMLKRLRPAPQGRAHRIRKRSNHVTLTIASGKRPELEPVEAESNQTDSNNSEEAKTEDQ